MNSLCGRMRDERGEGMAQHEPGRHQPTLVGGHVLRDEARLLSIVVPYQHDPLTLFETVPHRRWEHSSCMASVCSSFPVLVRHLQLTTSDVIIICGTRTNFSEVIPSPPNSSWTCNLKDHFYHKESQSIVETEPLFKLGRLGYNPNSVT